MTTYTFSSTTNSSLIEFAPTSGMSASAFTLGTHFNTFAFMLVAFI